MAEVTHSSRDSICRMESSASLSCLLGVRSILVSHQAGIVMSVHVEQPAGIHVPAFKLMLLQSLMLFLVLTYF